MRIILKKRVMLVKQGSEITEHQRISTKSGYLTSKSGMQPNKMKASESRTCRKELMLIFLYVSVQLQIGYVE